MKPTRLISILLVATLAVGLAWHLNRPKPIDVVTQAAEIALIFDETQHLREEERERSRAVADEIRATTHAQVLEVLDPDQQALFEEQRQEREQMRQAIEEFRAERGFGGGRGTGVCNG